MPSRPPAFGVARIICVLSVLASALATGTSAQSNPENTTIATTGGTFQLAPLASLTADAAFLSAERVAELALPAAQKDVLTVKGEVDTIDADIKANFTVMEKEKETLAKARAEFQPTLNAYAKDLEALRAADEQFGKDKAPLQKLIDAYSATPQKDRT